jgi:hypothetical protein
MKPVMRRLTLVSAAAMTGALIMPSTAWAAGPRPRAANGEICTIVGSSRNDHLVGRTSHDVICGLGGNDVISGNSGADVLDGGPGNDIMIGGAGADVFAGGPGTDTVDYSALRTPVTAALDGRAASGAAGEKDRIGIDVEALVGGSGDDTLTGNSGANTIRGGAGNDRLTGGSGNDMLTGELGDDTLRGGPGNDKLSGGPGNDTGRGDEGDDQLSGDDGDDNLDGGHGSDVVDGGTGMDSCVIVSADVSPRDACSDKQQPRIRMSALQWKGPKTVHNDEPRTVTLMVHASDDRSGISYGGAYLNAPNVAYPVELHANLHGGKPTNGVWYLSGTLPAGATTGEWHVTQVFLSDRAGHSTQYWLAADGTYTTNVAGETGGTVSLGPLTVTGQTSDDIAPVIDLESLHWTNDVELDNSTDHTVGISVHVTDPGTGVRNVVGALWNEDWSASLPMYNRHLVSGTTKDGLWEMSTTLPAGATTGQWQLAWLQAADEMSQITNYDTRDNAVFVLNYGESSVAHPLLPLEVSGRVSDVAPPQVDLDSMSFATPSTVTNSVDQDVAVRIHLSDDVTGVDLSSFNLGLVGPGGATVQLYAYSLVSGTSTDGVWELHGHLPQHAPAGTWHLSHANVKDRGGRESNNQWLRDDTGEWSTTDPATPLIIPVLPTLTVQESELVNNI